MSKEKDILVDVKVGEGEEQKTVKIKVTRPTPKIMKAAGHIYTKAWYRYIADGIMTKQQLDNFMKDNKIWSEQKEKDQENLANEIRNLTKDLLQGQARRKRKASEGKDLALDIKQKRFELQSLISEKISLESNSAESLADNDKFDYLVAECTCYEDGKKVYKDVDDYSERADEEIAFASASQLAQMLYSLDKNFEAQLPENQFLKKYDYVNSDYELVDRYGKRVSIDGKNIDENGFYVNDKNQRVDADGNLLDEDGNLAFVAQYESDSKTKTKSKTKTDGQNIESV